MPQTAASKKNRKVVHSKSLPPGRLKIAEALRSLLEKKDFNSITTAEIARTAGVTEALIYKYFRDKRDLLHQVLAEYFEQYMIQFEKDLKGARGSLNKIRKTIWSHINVYSTDRVFAKILLLEVRSNPDYFKSRPYKLVKKYSRIVRDIIEEGMKSGEIRYYFFDAARYLEIKVEGTMKVQGKEATSDSLRAAARIFSPILVM